MYFTGPNDINEDTPSIVMAMHLWGIDKSMRDAAQRFADAGFAVAIPDLYAGMGAPSGENAMDHMLFVGFAQKLTFETVDKGVREAAALLKERIPQTRMAIAGFCMGGTMALRRSYGHADLFSAAAVWYGNVASVGAAQVDIPIVASFGEADHGIPVEKVREFEDALRVSNDVAIYPGAGHAFCDNARPTYCPDAAEDSWRRTIAFLRSAL